MGCDILLECLTTALANLESQRLLEKQEGWSPYSIWKLTGTGVLQNTLIDWDSPSALKSRFAGRVLVLAQTTAPIVRNRYRTYCGPRMHWSERQQRELLFD